MLTRYLTRLLMILGITFSVVGNTLAAEVDPDLPDYKPIAGISGSIKSVGSDTMNNLMAHWTEEFRKMYPAVLPEIEGKGSSTAPAALIAGTASFGPMSRPMKDAEIDRFEEKFGWKPTQLPVGIDMLAIYVNKDNPLAQRGLTMPEADAIFSSTRKFGHSEIHTWGDLGMSGDWKNAPINIYGRNSVSGTYGFFKKRALGGGDFKASVNEQPGSAGVVQGIARERYAIGYSGIGYKTADVATVPLALQEGEEYMPADEEHGLTGEYPLTRFLLIAVNVEPNRELDPLRREFIRFIYSKQGQAEVIKDGYLPVTAVIARRQLSACNIEPGF
ncbi:PstS family phosphate ABC transporter substrate-binding protein [Mucisphaera calidilacus]|uniref:Phosphate-binding protein n=1 Tax=Mucisphaera calidilacus TaxID=2527982 RepID=A0A518BVX4_9BACT|nr:PstS family phosphate ABC transporter substrate-binding protein [Mucisphaera calidilacus]QDU71130.1 Phosphate-binding protein PstS precursor [Mucisphaera calidilacus]